MNTQQKTVILKKHISQIAALKSTIKQTKSQINPSDFDPFNAPQIDLLQNILSDKKQIIAIIDDTYQNIKQILQQLTSLEKKKINVNQILDSLTSIKQIKKLSYGFGNNYQQIFKNINTYYLVKNKVYYCDKIIQKIQSQLICQINTTFKSQFQQQLKKTNSNNIHILSKILNLISQNSKIQQKNTSHDTLSKFYIQLLKKQFKTYEDDLFKIPIIGTNTSNSYIFFDIAKDIMKIIVTMISNYKSNILTIGGQQSLQQVILQIFKYAMNGIILQILMRQKKYFEIEVPAQLTKKKSKQPPPKFKDYLNQFSAIWNQIQRLKSHLNDQIPLQSLYHKQLQNNLNNCTTTLQLIKINSQATDTLKNFTRFKFNKLLQTSTFINSIWQINQQFLKKISDQFVKDNKQFYQSTQAQSFLVQSFSIFITSLKKAFQTLNMLIISPLITFTNSILVQQDSFHPFKQLFNRTFQRLPSTQSKYYTAIIIIINTIPLMPNVLKHQLASLIIPTQLNHYKIRLQSELKTLVQICEQKSKQIINIFIQNIISAHWFASQLKLDYKKNIDKWYGFIHQINDIFLIKTTQIHSSLILQQQFSLNTTNPKANRVLSQQNIINLEKQVRNVILFYQKKGCLALSSFKKILQYIQILLTDTDQNAKKLMNKFGIQSAAEIKKLNTLRKMKID